MSELQLVSELSRIAHIYLAGLGTAFTVVSAYVVALYYFIHRAPLILKIISFAFFTCVLIVLGILMLGAAIYTDALAVALLRIGEGGATSELIGAANVILNHDYAYLLFGLTFAIGAAVYLTLAYLTYFYRWPSAHAD
jgi:hypothetical protein